MWCYPSSTQHLPCTSGQLPIQSGDWQLYSKLATMIIWRYDQPISDGIGNWLAKLTLFAHQAALILIVNSIQNKTQFLHLGVELAEPESSSSGILQFTFLLPFFKIGWAACSKIRATAAISSSQFCEVLYRNYAPFDICSKHYRAVNFKSRSFYPSSKCFPRAGYR